MLLALKHLWQRTCRGLLSFSGAHLAGLAVLGAILIATMLTLPRYPSSRDITASQPASMQTAIGGPFALSGTNGKTVTQTSFPGKYLLVFFGYTYCPDVCPTTLTSLAAALQELGPRADLFQPLFVSVDPQRDTPEVLRNYVAHFDPRIIGLTGTKAQLESIEKAYKVYAAPYRTGDGPNDYLMDHSAIVYVMDPSGAFIGQLDPSSTGLQMAQELSRLISGEHP